MTDTVEPVPPQYPKLAPRISSRIAKIGGQRRWRRGGGIGSLTKGRIFLIPSPMRKRASLQPYLWNCRNGYPVGVGLLHPENQPYRLLAGKLPRAALPARRRHHAPCRLRSPGPARNPARPDCLCHTRGHEWRRLFWPEFVRAYPCSYRSLFQPISLAPQTDANAYHILPAALGSLLLDEQVALSDLSAILPIIGCIYLVIRPRGDRHARGHKKTEPHKR